MWPARAASGCSLAACLPGCLPCSWLPAAAGSAHLCHDVRGFQVRWRALLLPTVALARLPCVPVGGGPPARRPRCEPAARRVGSKPGRALPPPTGTVARFRSRQVPRLPPPWSRVGVQPLSCPAGRADTSPDDVWPRGSAGPCCRPPCHDRVLERLGAQGPVAFTAASTRALPGGSCEISELRLVPTWSCTT